MTFRVSLVKMDFLVSLANVDRQANQVLQELRVDQDQ